MSVTSSRLKAEEEQQKKDEEKARRDYIRNEYLRKKQLKLMVDMDEVIKPRSGSLKKKPRPKSIHRDVMESSTPPVRASGERHTQITHTHRQCLTAIMLNLSLFFAPQVCVLEASQYQAFLWRLSTWPTTTESNQITRRTTGETRSLPAE